MTIASGASPNGECNSAEATVPAEIVWGEIPAMTLENARHLLKTDHPLFPKGPIQIIAGQHVVKIYVYKDEYLEIRVDSPLSEKTFRTSKWAKAVIFALDQATMLARSIPVAIRTVQDEEALAYEQVKVCARHAGLSTTRVFQLVSQIGNVARKDLESALEDAAHLALLTKDKETPVATLIQLGKLLQEILSKHPYLSQSQMLADIEELFPTSGKILSTLELLDEFERSKEFVIGADSIKTYRSRISQFSAFIKKPLRQTTPKDVDRYVEAKFINRTGKVIEIKRSSHDGFATNLKTFFDFMIARRHYPPVLGNPVTVSLMGRSIQAAKSGCILTAEELQRWIDAAPGYCIPYIVLAADAGIRPETIPHMTFDMLDWQDRVFRIPPWAGKTYKGVYPRLSDAAFSILQPWRHCIGPVCPKHDIPQIARQAAIEAGIRDTFQDDARKSAISYRAAELRGAVGAQETMNEEFGNSDLVRRLFYRVYRSKMAAGSYFSYYRDFEAVVLTQKDAHQFVRGSRLALARVIVRQMSVERKITIRTTKEVKAEIARDAYKTAVKALEKGQILPSFATLQPDFPTGLLASPDWPEYDQGDLFSGFEEGI